MQLKRPGGPQRQMTVAVPNDFFALASIVLTTILIVILVSVLYFLREIFIPLALAILLSFVLAPGMRFLQRLHLPRGVAAILMVLAACAVLSGLGTVMASSVQTLAQDLPRYQTVLREKMLTIKGITAGSRTLDQATSILQDLSKELQTPEKTNDAVRRAGAQPPPEPVPVVIREGDRGALATISALITPLLNPLATTGVIIVFVIFILVQRGDLRDRLIRLTGTRDLGRTTAAIDDAAHRLSRFYLVQLALNSGFGICVGVGLWAIGVPSPVIWGILAAVLRFVPYIGSFISAVLPILLAAAVEPGWTMMAETAAMFVVIESVVGQAIEPLVYGHSTGLSPIAVVVCATFWTWLWGPIGLVMATPLTVCLVVLGRHVERLRFLEVMFGDRPALSPPEIFYQRMLASDPAEAADHAEQFLKKRTLLTYYETVALEGLRLAQTDLNNGLLDREQTDTVASAAMDVVRELDDADDLVPKPRPGEVDAETAAAVEASDSSDHPTLPTVMPEAIQPEWREGAVFCVAGQSELDHVAASILAQLITKHGLPAQTLPPSSLRTADLFRLDLSHARWICLSFIDASSAAHMRQAVKKLRRKAPSATIVLAVWTAEPDDVGAISSEAGVAVAVRSLQEAAAAALSAATQSAVSNSGQAEAEYPSIRHAG